MTEIEAVVSVPLYVGEWFPAESQFLEFGGR